MWLSSHLHTLPRFFYTITYPTSSISFLLRIALCILRNFYQTWLFLENFATTSKMNSRILSSARTPLLHRTMCQKASQTPSPLLKQFWAWTTQPRPSWRESKTEALIAMFIFGITGSSSVMLVRPALSHVFGLEGSMIQGPWSYRIESILMVSPIYACMLMVLGTAAGRHNAFAGMAMKILNRFMPSSLSKKLTCPPGRLKFPQK